MCSIYVKLKDRKRSLSGKTTTTRCGIRETATTRNVVLWLFLNNRNALWHVMIYHDANVTLWLLKEMATASSGFMKVPQTAEEVAYQLMDTFCMFGVPFMLQSYNGRELANKIIQNLADMWPGMKLLHGKQRHSQSQGSVERSNQGVRDILVAWMSDNNTKTWSEGLRVIQSKKHRALQSVIKTIPYEAMFGTVQRTRLGNFLLTEDTYSSIETEEELEQLFNAGMNNGRDKEDKEQAYQRCRKDEDENQTISEERVEKKDNKMFTV